MITAARADRTSFGCSDTAEFTYFGRAYFQQALSRTRSFVDAFGIARDLIHQWETEQKFQHAEPQIDNGSLIQTKLEQWQATLPPRVPVTESATPAEPVVADVKQTQLIGQQRIYQRLSLGSLALSSIVLLVLLFAQLRAYLRHRERSLLVLTLSSAMGLAVLPFHLLAMGAGEDAERFMHLFYASLVLTIAQWMSAVIGTLALLRSYGSLAERVRVEPSSSPNLPALLPSSDSGQVGANAESADN